MSKHSSFEMDLTEGRILPKLIKYALPLLCTNVLQLVFNAADIAVLGQFSANKDVAQAAVGNTGALINLIVGLFVGLSVGANVLIARCVGSNDEERAHRVVGTSVVISLLFGFLLMFVGVFGARTFLSWLIDTEKTSVEVLDLATKYVQIYFIGLPIIMLYNFNASVLRAVGDTIRPLIFLAIGGVINVGLNCYFVIVLHMDVEGVAIATVVSQAVSAVLTTIALFCSPGYAHLQFKYLRIYKDELLDMAKIGLPAGLQGCVFSLSNVVIQSTVTSFGTQVNTANTVASQIDGFIYNAQYSVALSVLAFVGQNLGAGKFDRVRKSTWVGLGAVSVVGAIVGGLVLLFETPLCSIFNDDPVIIALAHDRLFIICTTYYLCGIMDVMSNTLRGLGKSTVAMIISLTGCCGFRIFWIKVLGLCDTYTELYWVYPASWVVTFLCFFVCYFPCFKKVQHDYWTSKFVEHEEMVEEGQI